MSNATEKLARLVEELNGELGFLNLRKDAPSRMGSKEVLLQEIAHKTKLLASYTELQRAIASLEFYAARKNYTSDGEVGLDFNEGLVSHENRKYTRDFGDVAKQTLAQIEAGVEKL